MGGKEAKKSNMRLVFPSCSENSLFEVLLSFDETLDINFKHFAYYRVVGVPV